MEYGLSENIKSIYRRISSAAMRAGREPDEVRLIAVSKNVAASAMKEGIELGLRNLGENRVQEARDKITILRRELDFFCDVGPGGYEVCLHLIGHLQKNKAKVAVELFDWVHSVDSVELGETINNHAEKIGKKQKILVQVKLSDEESKYGIIEEKIYSVLDELSAKKNLSLEGLMTIPPFFEDPEKVRPYFRKMREIRDSARAKGFILRELSMGMSGDFEVAVEEGATMVRVGTAIFGERKKEAA